MIRSRLLVPLLSGLLCAFPLYAANLPPEGTKPAPPEVLPQKSPILIDIDFSGGTIAQFVTALSRENTGVFNLIGEKADLDSPLPPFSIRRADPNALAYALDTLLRPRGLTVTGSNLQFGGIYIVKKLPPDQIPPVFFGPKSTFLSIQLAPYLERQSVDDIVGAIRNAWALDPDHRPEQLRLQYHPATKLLLASGPNNEAGNIIGQVIGTLERSPPQSAKGNPNPAPVAAPNGPK